MVLITGTSQTWNSDWLWENSQRAYPLLDGVDAMDVQGVFHIPETFLLDMVLSVPSSSVTLPADYYILQVASFAGGYIVHIGHEGQIAGTFSIPATGHTWGKTYPIFRQVDADNIATGTVAIGNLDEINEQPAGAWTFEADHTRIQPRCIIPAAPGMPGFRVRSAGVESRLLKDLIILEPGHNSRLRVDTDSNTVYFDAVGNDDFLAACVCEGTRELGEPIRTINGVAPNASGDFSLQPGRDCLEIEPISFGLQISDACSTPCCGCEELDIINEALRVLRNQVATLDGFAQRLETTTQNLQNVVLSSPLYIKVNTGGP